MQPLKFKPIVKTLVWGTESWELSAHPAGNSIIASGIYDEIHIEVNPNMTLGEGIQAPKIPLKATPDEVIGGNMLYTILK